MTQNPDLAIALLRNVLTRVRDFAGREVRFGPEGIVFVDAMGKVRPLLVDGKPFEADVGLLKEIFLQDLYWFRSMGVRTVDQGEADVMGHGVWRANLSTSIPDGVLSLKAKKPAEPVLEFLFDADPADMALLRAGYGLGGCDVFLFVEGETRAGNAATALCAERRLAGFRTTGSFGERFATSYGRNGNSETDWSGPDRFDRDAGTGPAWNVSWIRRHPELSYGEHDRTVEILRAERTTSETEVFVATHSNRDFWMSRFDVKDAGRPTVFVTVSIRRSKPVASFSFSDSWREAVAGTLPDPEAPWTVLKRRRAIRSKARASIPKTWHKTTSSVAEAFLERAAPRGLISGGSLFFHGPIAYSLWNNNPVAAIVDAPDGGPPLLFVGRQEHMGGTKAGTVTSAIGDILAAELGRYRTVHVDALGDFLRIGDIRPEKFALVVEYGKNEASYPSTCRIDGDALAAFVSAKRDECVKTIERALTTKFPTGVQAAAYRGFVRLSETRELLAPLVDVVLPSVTDAASARAEAARIERLAKVRHRDQAQRRALQSHAFWDPDAGISRQDDEPETRNPFEI